MTLKLVKKSSNGLVIGLMVAATAATALTTYYGISLKQRSDESSTEFQAVKTAIARNVTALGRLEPQAEVIRLAAPQALDNDRVAKLLVKQGDRVQARHVIAILDSRARLEVALQEAQQQVKVAQYRVAQVKAGAKTGEIQAQKATIAKLQAELQGEIATQEATITRWRSEVSNAQAEINRFQSLYNQGAIAASERDTKRLALETAQAQLKEATARQNRTVETLQAQISEANAILSRVTEVRPVDIQVAQSEVDRAIVTMKRAQTDLNQAYIRAPMAGQILKIHTRPGERLSTDGIVSMGQTDDMIAIAEIYQTDIAKVRVGQTAVITSQAFPGEVKGTVYEVGLFVNRQNVFSAQPGQNLDRRVIEVKIRLSPKESKRVANLTNLQVEVAIEV